MQPTKNSSPVLVSIVLSLFVFLFVFFLYTFLHESGHALVGKFFGQTLTEFNVSFWDFSAHVGMAGEELSPSQLAVQSAAGAGFPLLIWAVFMGLVPRKTSFILEVLKLVSSMAVVNTLLVWIILPILFSIGKAPSDDVTNFLNHSQMPPLLLSLIAVILYTGGWALFLSKINGLRNEFHLFGTTNRELLMAGTWKTVSVMGGIVAACILLSVALNTQAAKHSFDRFSPPQDFEPVVQIDLSKQAYSSETLAEFTLKQSGNVGVFVVVRNIDTTYFDLSITGPNDFNFSILHGEGYSAYQDGGLWEQPLPPGTYQLKLTSHQSPGTVSVFLKVTDSQ